LPILGHRRTDKRTWSPPMAFLLYPKEDSKIPRPGQQRTFLCTAMFRNNGDHLPTQH
jgi:hypothetical protein